MHDALKQASTHKYTNGTQQHRPLTGTHYSEHALKTSLRTAHNHYT